MSIPPPVNEPVKSYAPGTPERAEIREAIAGLRAGCARARPGDRRARRDDRACCARCASRTPTRRVLARWHSAGADETRQAIDAALEARAEWASWTLEQRAAVFLRAADLLAGPWRADLNAATMLGQSKTVQQAEIDSACEIIDFFRFNATFASELAEQQPISSPGVWNRLELRPLDGFVFAISPFNFTAIGANLPAAPALMGNTVVWKPASTAVVSAHRTMRLLQAAGLPDGVINLVPGDAAAVSGACLAHPDLAGLHFTGSTEVFQNIWREVGQRIAVVPQLPAHRRRDRVARTSSSCTARPSRRRSRPRSCAARSSTRDRSARPRRARTSRSRSGTRCTRASPSRSGASASATSRTSATSWAPSSTSAPTAG